jgi:predicted nucleic acid-binding Zn ribbon protein
MMTLPLRRLAAAGLAMMLSALLAACFVLPGKFASTLDLRKDGRFAYTYKGEVWVMGLSKLSEMGAGAGKFEPSTCYKDDDAMSQRECSSEELAAQKAAWEIEQQAGAEKRKKEAEEMKALLGGIDPSDPKSGEELAARLRRQAGWKSVAYKGDGLYDVDFAIAGRIDHDFNFPTIERMAMMTPFVALSRRADNTVRIDTPGFALGGGSNPMAAMGGLAAMGAAGEDGGKGPKFPKIEGTFTVTTDGAILANNTDEGPQADTAGQRLSWTVDARNPAAPTALIRLGN